MKFKVIAYKSSEWREAVSLRELVLRSSLGINFSDEELEAEKDHIQIGGFTGKDLVATAVLVPEGIRLKMQRVAVDEKLRNQGIGSKMISYCEALAKERGFEHIYCHARDSAVNFYTNNHYSPEGAYFIEDGIPHLRMSKPLGREKARG